MKVKLLEQRNPAYDGRRLAQMRALYAGGADWVALRDTWFPKNPEEMPDTWDHRLSLATYENHAGGIVGLLAAALFAEAPAVDGVTGDWVEGFLANVDGKGTPLGPWFTERLVDALVGRRVFVWINLPARQEGVVPETRADEEKLGLLDAFLVTLPAEQVIDWHTDERGRLVWLMVRDVVEVRASVEASRQKVHRWTYIDATKIRRWRWTPPETAPHMPPNPEEDAAAEPEVLHGFGALPVAWLELPETLHAMGRLHDPALAHLRADGDLSWALYRAAHALLCIKSEWDEGRPVLGAGYFLRLGKDDDAFYAEPSGANFEILRRRVADLREELYRVLQQMAVGASSSTTRQAQSGESKASDWRSMEILLGALAGVMRSLIGETIRLVAKARGLDVQPTVKGLDGWQTENLLVWLEAAAMCTEAMRMSPSFQKAVAKRQAQRILQGEDPELAAAVEQEIDEAETDPAPYQPPPRAGLPPADDPAAAEGELLEE